MPKLPNAELATIEGRKIMGYLLAESHLKGTGKAGFFAGFGFRREAAEVLAAALLAHASSNEVLFLQSSQYGVKYVIEGPLVAPDGRAPSVRAVWIVDAGDDAPRFVTAFPGRRIIP